MHHAKCSTKELKILGDFWTLELIQTLADGDKRFSQLQKELKGVSPTTLTNRLKKLETQNLISSKKETIDKLSVVYCLTEKGEGILPVLTQIKLFANKYL